MEKSNSNLSFSESDIDLLSVFKKIVDSKKIIFFSTTIFTLLAFIFSLSEEPVYQSSTILEVGTYENIDGDLELINTVSKAIEDLKINLFEKNLTEIKIRSLNDRMIELSYSSNSSEKNIDVLSDLSQDFVSNHQNIIDSITTFREQKVKKLITNIEKRLDHINTKINFELIAKKDQYTLQKLAKITESEFILNNKLPSLRKIISNLENKQSNQSESSTNESLITVQLEAIETEERSVVLSNEIDELNKLIESIDNNTSFNEQLGEMYFHKAEIELSLETAEQDLIDLANLQINESSARKGIKTKLLKSKQNLIISIGLIFGILLSFVIILVKELINNSKKASN